MNFVKRKFWIQSTSSFNSGIVSFSYDLILERLNQPTIQTFFQSKKKQPLKTIQTIQPIFRNSHKNKQKKQPTKLQLTFLFRFLDRKTQGLFTFFATKKATISATDFSRSRSDRRSRSRRRGPDSLEIRKVVVENMVENKAFCMEMDEFVVLNSLLFYFFLEGGE